jgi:hypothetical protein
MLCASAALLKLNGCFLSGCQCASCWPNDISLDNYLMKMPVTNIPNAQNDRKKRLADALRQNLQLRKARVRAGESPESADTESTSKDKAPKG